LYHMSIHVQHYIDIHQTLRCGLKFSYFRHH